MKVFLKFLILAAVASSQSLCAQSSSRENVSNTKKIPYYIDQIKEITKKSNPSFEEFKTLSKQLLEDTKNVKMFCRKSQDSAQNSMENLLGSFIFKIINFINQNTDKEQNQTLVDAAYTIVHSFSLKLSKESSGAFMDFEDFTDRKEFGTALNEVTEYVEKNNKEFKDIIEEKISSSDKADETDPDQATRAFIEKTEEEMASKLDKIIAVIKERYSNPSAQKAHIEQAKNINNRIQKDIIKHFISENKQKSFSASDSGKTFKEKIKNLMEQYWAPLTSLSVLQSSKNFNALATPRYTSDKGVRKSVEEAKKSWNTFTELITKSVHEGFLTHQDVEALAKNFSDSLNDSMMLDFKGHLAHKLIGNKPTLVRL